MGTNVDRWSQRLGASRRRKDLRDRAIAHLGGKCQICGYNKCPEAFDFHHVSSFEKEFNISSKMTSWGAIERELAKCVLLCSNCHREVHAGYHAGYLEDESADRSQY